MATEPQPTAATDDGRAVERLWYIPPKPIPPQGFLVYSRDFILAAMQGRITAPQQINRAWYWQVLAVLVLSIMAVIQSVLMLLAVVPITSCLLETISRVFTRNAAGFFLRACYWKAKLKYLGQDTIIDQGVEIWGPAAVSIGSQCHIDTNVRLAAGERRQQQHGWITIGDYVHLGPGVHIAGRGGVKIGDFVGIMANAHLYSATGVLLHPADPGRLISMTHMAPHDQQYIVEAPIHIDDYACIGMMSRVMPGVRVGRGAVIHANAELTHDVAPFANLGAIPRGRQIGWRKPRRASAFLVRGTALEEEIAALGDQAPATGIRIRELLNSNEAATLAQVIDLHIQAFPDGVTTQLGRRFLHQYYVAMVNSHGASLWIAERDGEVCGFLGCATDRFAFERAHRSGAARALALWRFITLRLSPIAVVRSIRKKRLAHGVPERAELLSIVVAPTLRRSGLGKRFLNLWLHRLRLANIAGFIVFTDNPEGINFYEKYGGETLFKFNMRSVWSACYRFRVGPASGFMPPGQPTSPAAS